MESNLIITLSTILLIPLIPAFILYKFLPSKTVVTGPFKGLNVNLTGAFSGYFLLVIVSLGLTYYLSKNKLSDQLQQAQSKIENLESQLLIEKNKFHPWKMTGTIESETPEVTKIFIDEENISINSIGRFNATLLIRSNEENKMQLPGAVCFFHKVDGYRVIDLSNIENVTIDSVGNLISLKQNIKLNPVIKRN